MVVENNHLVYNEGVTKLFLYTKGTKGGSQPLKDLLTFMEDTTSANAVDEELQAIQKIVDTVKTDKEVGKRYMTLQEMIDYEKKGSYDVGVEHGRTEGIQAVIDTCKSFNQDKAQTRIRIMNQFHLTEDKADKYLNLYW